MSVLVVGLVIGYLISYSDSYFRLLLTCVWRVDSIRATYSGNGPNGGDLALNSKIALRS